LESAKLQENIRALTHAKTNPTLISCGVNSKMVELMVAVK